MACINPNSSEFKAALERTGGNPLLAEIEVDRGVQIKPGVAELFESTPELANAVYEALGFRKTVATEMGTAFKEPSKFSQEDYDTLKDMGYTEDEILDKLAAKKSETVLAKTIVTPEQKQQAQQLYSNFLSNFVNNNFDTIIQDLQSKNILDKKCN